MRSPRIAQGVPIGCGRLLPDGHIGRVAVMSDWRGQGVGAALLVRLIDLAKARGDKRVLLNAQTQAMPFYARYGFAPTGERIPGSRHSALDDGAARWAKRSATMRTLRTTSPVAVPSAANERSTKRARPARSIVNTVEQRVP